MQKIDAPVQLQEQVYQALLDAICDGRLAPHARITQEGLAEMLGVSRQPIFQAIHVLKSQGFIVDAGRKGIMVTAIDPDNIVHLYQVRGALDALAARQAAFNVSRNPDAVLIAAGHALVTQGLALQKNGTLGQWIQADMQFHQCIYALSGNPVIAQTSDMHWHHIRRAMGAILKAGVHQELQVWSEHQAIFEAICRGDAAQAELLARQHAEMAATYLAKQWRDDAIAHRQHA